MKLTSNGVGQLRMLRRILIEASSPVDGTTGRFAASGRAGPKAKTFPPFARASWSFFVVPMFGLGPFLSFRLSARWLTWRIPPVPLPSYAIELIRAEVISMVPKRSRKSEIWRPAKIQLATMAITNATRTPSVMRILRTAALFVATALCRCVWKSFDGAWTLRGGYRLRFLSLNIIVYLFFENLER